MNWKSVARDVVIVVGLTFIGGFIIGVASAGRPLPMQAIALSNMLLGTIGFFIAGCLTRTARWKHLVVVALFVWIVGLINVAFFGVEFRQWILSWIAIVLMMAIGGGLSFLFVRQKPPESPPPLPPAPTP